MARLFRLLQRSVIVFIPFGLIALLSLQVSAMHNSVHPVALAIHPAGSTILQPPPPPVVVPPPTPPPPAPVAAAPTSAPKSTKKVAAAPVPAPAPPTDIAPASACPNQGVISQSVAVILCMTNYARHFHGVAALAYNTILNDAAVAKAADIITCNDFSHTACGHPADYWIVTKGYPGYCSGENIAKYYPTPGQVFQIWMGSPGHRDNILNPVYVDLGVAEQSSSGGPVYVMDFGGCL